MEGHCLTLAPGGLQRLLSDSLSPWRAASPVKALQRPGCDAPGSSTLLLRQEAERDAERKRVRKWHSRSAGKQNSGWSLSLLKVSLHPEAVLMWGGRGSTEKGQKVGGTFLDSHKQLGSMEAQCPEKNQSLQ